jgi:hypothetical protein
MFNNIEFQIYDLIYIILYIMTVFNVDDILIDLAKSDTQTFDINPYNENISININCLELNNNLLLIFVGSGIGWFFVSNKILNTIKNYCCKKFINRNNENNLVLAEHVV